MVGWFGFIIGQTDTKDTKKITSKLQPLLPAYCPKVKNKRP
jgi:hypothetical protein